MPRGNHWSRSPESRDTTDDLDRECRQGPYCAGAIVVFAEGGEARRGAPTSRAFCDADRGKVETALAALPRDYAALAADLGNPGHGGPAVRSPFGPRIPLNLGAEALMRAITESLTSWHDRVAAVASLTPPPEDKARDEWLVSRAVAVLSPRLDALLAVQPQPMRRAATHHLIQLLGDSAPDGIVRSGYVMTWPDLDGGDAGLEILRLHRMTRAVLGETRPKPVELLGVPCRVEECDLLALRRADLPDDFEPGDEDAPWSECAACGDLMSEAEYRNWVKRYAQWATRQAETLGNLPACRNALGRERQT